MDWLAQSRRSWLVLQKLLVVLLVALSAVYAARLTWLWIQPVPEVSVPTIRPAASGSGQGGNNLEQMGETLAQRELFGEYQAEPVAQAEERPVEAPETQLQLTLQAVLAQSGQGRGFAIIAQRNGQSKAFSVGDQVFNQAELSAVYGDRVILSRNGQMETLRYERAESSGLMQPNEEVASEPVDQESFESAVQQAQEQAASGADVQAQVEQMVSYIGQRANSDPEGLLNEVGLEPTGSGYRVTRDARQLQMAGLRPGDIVTAVNDNPVGNIGQDQALLNQILQSGGELKIQIQRGSRSFTIYQSIPNF